jgi:hypothetical protein
MLDKPAAEALSLLATLVGQVGFPVVVAVYLLTRFDRLLRDVVAQLGELVVLLRVQVGAIPLSARVPRERGTGT